MHEPRWLSPVLKIWSIFLLAIGAFVVYGFGRIQTMEEERIKYSTILEEKTYAIENLNQEVGQKVGFIENMNSQLGELTDTKDSLFEENNNLKGQVAGLMVENNKEFPFIVPSNGTIGSYAGSYGGNMHGYRHLGIDLWTTTENNGKTGTHTGNLVYAACNGVVDNMDRANGAITIKCDPIPDHFDVPEHQVYTYYAHMGHAENKSLYIKVHPSQRVEQGQLIGKQGDISKFFPNMRNVHLHFSVFGGLSETDKKKGAYNPCLYIGGDCMYRGSEFEVNL